MSLQVLVETEHLSYADGTRAAIGTYATLTQQMRTHLLLVGIGLTPGVGVHLNLASA